MVATPGAAAEARLVHCGDGTCLRIAGHRPQLGTQVRIAGHSLSVQGDRSWHATVPLATARDWANSSGDTMMLTLADPQTGTATIEPVALPPGALGKPIELASLVVRAH